MTPQEPINHTLNSKTIRGSFSKSLSSYYYYRYCYHYYTQIYV